MERNVLSRAAEFIKAQRQKKRWTKAVSAMAAVVVFCTTYALILPAITLQAECGKEDHTHSDACYTVETVTPQPTMLCSLETLREAGLHEHDDGCYDDEDQLICGFADFVVHVHDKACYDLDGNLICTLEEIEEHQHDADCYREKRVLVCDQEETDGHRHDEDCYDQVRGDLICTSEEEDHEHSDDCYEWSRELVCGQEETQGHTHSEDCYETERVLDCEKPEVELHEHDEDCYEENPDDPDNPILVCHKTVVLEHQHGEDCVQPPEGEPYEKKVFTCDKEEHEHTEACYLTEPPVEEPQGADEEAEADAEDAEETSGQEPAASSHVQGTAYASRGAAQSYSMMLLDDAEETTGPLDVENYVTGATLYYRTDENTEWINVTGAENIPGDADLRLDVTYKNVPLATLLSNEGKLTYTLPSILRDPVANGEVTSGSKTVGTITVNGNVLTIDFYETWLQELQNDGSTTLDGTFYVESQINLSEVGEGGTATLQIGSVTIEANFEENIIAKNADVDIAKAVSSDIISDESGDYLEYTLTATAGADGCPEVEVVDSFTANGADVSYVGLSSTATNLESTGSPSEVIEDGKTHGSICQKGGSLVWTIGNMEANETRTLTYRVKLGEGYTYLQNSSSKAISNEAQVYAGEYPRDSATANFEPKAGLGMKKTASKAVRQEDGSYVITYTVWVEAYSTNNFTLDNVRIEDQLNHPNNATAEASLAYISYVKGSFKLYDNKNAAGSPLEFTISEEIPVNPAMNEDEKGFAAYVGDMEPGTVRCIQYQVRVGLEAIGEAGGKTLNVKNRALAYSDNAKNGGNNWLKDCGNTKTIQYDHWAKKLAGDPLTADKTIAISGTIYDATEGTPTIESHPPGSFTAPVGSYQYTVTVNELRDWDVTSASMKDDLGDQHMQFVGYVKVEGYIPADPKDSNSVEQVKETIWVKVDGTQTFSFTLAQLGLTGNTYAYRLTYYAKPVQVDDISLVVVSNRFGMDGDIGIGDYKFIITGIEASADVIVQGGHSFEAQKMAWYYEGPKTSSGIWANGALYWVIKVDGTDFTMGTYLQDYTTSQSAMVFRSDSLVGVYTGSFPDGTALTDYSDITAAQNSGCLTAVNSDCYTATLSNSRNLNDLNRVDAFSELTIQMNRTVTLGSNSMYIVVKLEPDSALGDRAVCIYNNYLKSSDDGSNWQDRGSASKTLYGGSNILKEFGCAFSYDGKTTSLVTSGRDYRIIQNQLSEPGLYVAWAVKVNYSGDLSGQYRVVDTIPDGMDLAYARIKWRGSKAGGTPGAQMVPIEDLGEGWTEHTFSATTDNGNTMTSYYYTSADGKQICWEVDNLIAGHEKDNYSVDFQVVCRVTDPEVLLGGASKEFNNEVVLVTETGSELDSAVNEVTISTSTMSKSAVWSGSSIPFTITVNPLGEDLLEGTETLTVVDTLSDTLKLDPTTITVVNTNTKEAVAFTASQDGQVLRIGVPDNQPLTISYNAKVQAAPNTEVSIKNDAHWEGYAITGGSSAENKTYQYAVGGTAGGTATPFVEIVKYDQNNLTSYLAGATFRMLEGTMENGVFTPSADTTRVWKGTTDENGRLKFGADPLMAYNTVYQITETAAPDGYVLDSTPYYFIVAKANENGMYPEYPGGVTVYYDSSTYTCEVPNHKGEATVEKMFEDAGGYSLDRLTGTYRFGIYDSENPTGDPLQTVMITYDNGTVTPEGGRAKFTNLELGKTYYIYELDDDEQPIKDGALAAVDGKIFEVTYTNGPVVTVPADGTAAVTVTVTVTNRVHYTVLPETGGAGTLAYTAGGAALMAGALGYVILRKRKEEL